MSVLPTGTVTFLFTDIEGSTRLLQALDGRSRDVFERHLELITQAVGAQGGMVVRTEGDAVFAVFTSAPAAVTAAVTAQRSLQAEPWDIEQGLWVRMGLHTGEGSEGSGDYHGLDVHQAARIGDSGHGGQILLSETTRPLVERSLPPGTRLRDLGPHRLRDLAGAERLYQVVIEDLRTEFPPLRTLEAISHNLPVLLTRFIGRQAEVDRVATLLHDRRLLTLTGPGGTGKTRLSLQVAASASSDYEGVYFVPLAPVTDHELVAPTVVSALGLSQGKEDPVVRLGDFLGDKRWLLVLDNFEQVLDAAPMVSDLLSRAKGLSVLATSRAPLHLSGEQEYPVPPLDLPSVESPDLESLGEVEAVRLFVDRAQAAQPRFALDQTNAGAVAEIVERLDGLPLAIELAAARIKLLPPQTMVKRLGDRLDLLVSGRRDQPERQQTLRGAIDWSYDLLDTTTRAVFERTSVFAGGATLEALETTCADATLDRIEMLVDHSLLRLSEERDEPRFWMLQTIREYAAEKLESSGRGAEGRDRHLGWCLGLAEEAAPHLTGSDPGPWLERLETERDNLRSALSWAIQSGKSDEAARLLFAQWRFWHMRGPLFEGMERAAAVLAMPGLSDGSRLRALEVAGGLAYWKGNLAQTKESYQAALDLARRLGNPATIANALYNRAFANWADEWAGSPSLGMVEEALSIYRRLGDRTEVARMLWGLGTILSASGDHEKSLGVLAEALAEYQHLDDAFHLGWTHRMLASGLLILKRPAEAVPHVRAALDIFAPAGDMSGVVLLLRDCAQVSFQQGQTDRALTLIGAARAHQDKLGLDLLDVGIGNEIPELDEALNQVEPRFAAELLERGAALTTAESLTLAREALGT